MLSVEVVVRKMVCWTDSLVALWWIKRVDKNWKVWVENRVRKRLTVVVGGIFLGN